MSALDDLKIVTAWETEPALTTEELAAALAGNALADTAGFLPLDEGWSETYDLDSAAAKAWLIKAAKAAALVEADPPGSGIMTSKVFDNCCRMAAAFAARRRGSVSTAR
jgi:hypothetical protein